MSQSSKAASRPLSEVVSTPQSSAGQASAMKVTRVQHASETAQDYLEAIGVLIEEKGEARVVDLAARLGLSHATVIQTVARLREKELVTSEPYRSIFLTRTGRKIANEARHRHAVTVAALIKLGVSRATADVDAESIEHHVSRETLRVFEALIRKA